MFTDYSHPNTAMGSERIRNEDYIFTHNKLV